MSCRLCSEHTYICEGNSRTQMQCYLKLVHKWTSGLKGGRPPKVGCYGIVKDLYFIVITSPVSYLTFYQAGFVCYFQVARLALLFKSNISMSKKSLAASLVALEDHIKLQLAWKLQTRDAATSLICQPLLKPLAWLQTTK
jgi:hypothetical protein